jgi:hypothetical protein
MDGAAADADQSAAVNAERSTDVQAKSSAGSRPVKSSYSHRLGSSRSGGRGTDGRLKRLQDEMESMKAIYAHKIANTATKCEQILREKENERREWYKERRLEIAKLNAGLVVMYAHFSYKSRRQIKQMVLDQRRYEEQKIMFADKESRLKAENRAARESNEAELAKGAVLWEEQIAGLTRQNSALAERGTQLEKQLESTYVQEKQLRSEHEANQQKIDTLRRRVLEIERAEEPQRARVEALERELRKTKKEMTSQRVAETTSLRRELMDYVKFIVQILPDDDGGEESRTPSPPPSLKPHLRAAGKQPKPKVSLPSASGDQPLPPVASPRKRVKDFSMYMYT